MEQRNYRKWTAQEDATLLNHVKARPQNLRKCFMAVAERTGRTEGAVANRWYTVVSKKENSICFFTASPHHVSKNRKNGEGTSSNVGIWRRLMRIIRGMAG